MKDDVSRLLLAIAEMLDHYAAGLEVGLPQDAIVAQIKADAANLRGQALQP